MKKSKIILVTATALVVGAVVGGLVVSRALGRYYTNAMNMTFAGDANMAIGTLRPLRGGDTTNAIELLEIRLDGALIGLWATLKDESPSRRDPLQMRVLKSARAYRKQFPRKARSAEADEPGFNPFELLDEKAL